MGEERDTRPFVSAPGLAMLAALAALAVGVPASTRLAPLSWRGVAQSPQWWSNARLMGPLDCMSGLYEEDEDPRRVLFEPPCAPGWGSRGNDDYTFGYILYRLDRAAMVEIVPKTPTAMGADSLALLDVRVGEAERVTFGYDANQRLRKTESWWNVDAGDGLVIDRLDLVANPDDLTKVASILIQFDRYPYDKGTLRTQSESAGSKLWPPTGAVSNVPDRPHVWMSHGRVGVRPVEDRRGTLESWETHGIEDDTLDAALTRHHERRPHDVLPSIHVGALVSRLASAREVLALQERVLDAGFKGLTLYAVDELGWGYGGLATLARSTGDPLPDLGPVGALRDAARPDHLGILDVTPEGFTLRGPRVEGAPAVAPIERCPPDGPTVCLRAGDEGVLTSLERAKRAESRGEPKRAGQALEALMARFDFHALHELLIDHARSGHLKGSTVIVRVHPELPNELVVRLMTLLSGCRTEGLFEATPPSKCPSAPLTREQMERSVRCMCPLRHETSLELLE